MKITTSVKCPHCGVTGVVRLESAFFEQSAVHLCDDGEGMGCKKQFTIYNKIAVVIRTEKIEV